jgi:hypothetical protein
MLDCGPLVGTMVGLDTAMGHCGIAAAAFLHSVTINTTMSLVERHHGSTAVALLHSSMYRVQVYSYVCITLKLSCTS